MQKGHLNVSGESLPANLVFVFRTEVFFMSSICKNKKKKSSTKSVPELASFVYRSPKVFKQVLVLSQTL